MKKKFGLLVVSFSAFMMMSILALALAQGGIAPMGTCDYQYTYCSDDTCGCSGGGIGAAGHHVYHCDTPPYVRTPSTCCDCS